MIKTARQLKDLIRNLSKNKSADAQILMRNYMTERFLERISLSEYRDKFILKGGILVAAMVGLDARSTMDIDATVKGATVGIEEVENMIASIVSVPLDDGVEFRGKRISEIMDEADPNMEKLWQAYQKKFTYAADLPWHTVTESVRRIYELVKCF